MSNFSNPADVSAVYVAELEQLEEQLRSLRKRATQARAARQRSDIGFTGRTSAM